MKRLSLIGLFALTGCASGGLGTLTHGDARAIGCMEACARAVKGTERPAAWPDGTADCGCRRGDGTIFYTCERPGADGECGS